MEGIVTQEQQQQPVLIQHTEPDTEAWLGAQCLGSGQLQINENCLTWSGPDRQFALPHSAVYAHALAKTGSGCPSGRPHLLLMALLEGAETPEEVRLCPDSADRLQTLFDAMSGCQALLSALGDQDNGEGGEHFYGYGDDNDDGDEEDAGNEDGGPDFDHLLVGDGGDSNGADQPMDAEDQFEDAH